MPKPQTAQTEESQSVLAENWPPKWFFSYANVAILMMTFCIILATMLSLDIPIYFLADKTLREVLEKEMAGIAESEMGRAVKKTGLRFTEADKYILRELEKLDIKQIYNIISLEKIKTLTEQIRNYIVEQGIEESVLIEEDRWKVRITPAEPVFFNKGTVALKPEAKHLLNDIGNFLKHNPDYFIRIEGHTDNIPVHNLRFPSNWELSMARAQSVMKYLLDKFKIPVERIKALGYGEYQPVAPNDSETNRAKNRRVVLELVPMAPRPENP